MTAGADVRRERETAGRGSRTGSLPGGLLMVNADDWGRDRTTTDRTLECLRDSAVSSVSAMVFMEDSERAARIARERGIETALHLNLTTPFSAPACPAGLVEAQRKLARHLLRHRLSPVVFHPTLRGPFARVVTAQLEEYRRLYGAAPDRVDGHHHMHLCANVLLGRLIPPGVLLRRNFSFQPGEKGLANVVYRRLVDGLLARRYRLADFFFSLPPLEPASRLARIVALARRFVVEVETHPIEPEEHRFLVGGGLSKLTDGVRIGPPSAISPATAVAGGHA